MSSAPPTGPQAPPEIDPRILFAAERTWLAWIRTSLALMGFGFVVARFGLFLREFAMVQHTPIPSHTALTLWVGVSLLVLGAGLCVAAGFEYWTRMSRLLRGEVDRPHIFSLAGGLTVVLAVLGLVLAVYLVSSS